VLVEKPFSRTTLLAAVQSVLHAAGDGGYDDACS
jgi:hypothetical protein